MGILINKDRCLYCAACVSVCPVDAIELRETRIMAFNDVCINCTACVRVCPVACITIDK